MLMNRKMRVQKSQSPVCDSTGFAVLSSAEQCRRKPGLTAPLTCGLRCLAQVSLTYSLQRERLREQQRLRANRCAFHCLAAPRTHAFRPRGASVDIRPPVMSLRLRSLRDALTLLCESQGVDADTGARFVLMLHALNAVPCMLCVSCCFARQAHAEGSCGIHAPIDACSNPHSCLCVSTSLAAQRLHACVCGH